MSLRKQFATDPKKINEGIPVRFGKNDDGTIPTFYVAMMHKSNTAYATLLERLLKPYQRQIQRNTLDKEVLLEVLREVFCRTILKGWENVSEADLNPAAESNVKLSFNVANAKALMETLPDLYDALNEAANDAGAFREEELEESAKN
jgi:hypothetical protein